MKIPGESEEYRKARDGLLQAEIDLRRQEEAVAAKPTAAFDAVYGQFVIDPGFFTRLVYEGV